MSNHVGIYRAVVASNKDPKDLGRLRVRVPQLFDKDISDWIWNAEGSKFSYELPSVGQGVYVIFPDGQAGDGVWLGQFGKPLGSGWYTYLKSMPPSNYPESIKTRSHKNKTHWDLTQTIITMANKIQTLEEEVDQLQTDLIDAESAISTLQGQVSSLDSRVSALENSP